MKIHASFDFKHFIFFYINSIMPVKGVRSKKHFSKISFFNLAPSTDIIVKRKLNVKFSKNLDAWIFMFLGLKLSKL